MRNRAFRSSQDRLKTVGPSKDGKDMPHDHQIFIGLYDAHLNAAFGRRYHCCVGFIAGCVQMNAQKFQTIADALANVG